MTRVTDEQLVYFLEISPASTRSQRCSETEPLGISGIGVFFTSRMPFSPSNEQCACQSTERIKKQWRWRSERSQQQQNSLRVEDGVCLDGHGPGGDRRKAVLTEMSSLQHRQFIGFIWHYDDIVFTWCVTLGWTPHRPSLPNASSDLRESLQEGKPTSSARWLFYLMHQDEWEIIRHITATTTLFLSLLSLF